MTDPTIPNTKNHQEWQFHALVFALSWCFWLIPILASHNVFSLSSGIQKVFVLAEVFGGPKTYTQKGGSHPGMVKKHIDLKLTEKHRQRFVKLMLEAVDETGLPDDPEFRSALVGYIEWGSRLAVVNSNGTQTSDLNQDEPMPEWGWGETGGPYITDN